LVFGTLIAEAAHAGRVAPMDNAAWRRKLHHETVPTGHSTNRNRRRS
jgi:hypothetical protein